MKWEPILASTRVADEAWTSIGAIAQATVVGDCERGNGEQDALLYAYLAAARSDEQWAIRATARLNAVIDEAASDQLWLGLFGGLCGLGWTVEHVSRLLDRTFGAQVDDDVQSGGDDSSADSDLNADIDGALLKKLRLVERGTWLDHDDYDLVRGLVGYGTYFLERWPAPAAKAGLELVIEHLDATAERTARGITWHTPPGLLPDWQRLACPGGYYNLGVAHGVPGVIHLLSEATTAGVGHEGAERLLDGAVDWLLAQRRPQGSGSWFGSWVAPGSSNDSRLAWCYGDLGVLSVLTQVARRRKREDLQRFAGELLDDCLDRRLEDSGVVDSALCHGAAGLAHIFNRLYQRDGDSRCRDAALRWFERLLAMRRPTSGAGGFLAATRPDPQGPYLWKASPAFLDGAVGVALALISAVTATEPSWDRLLLVSGRDWA